MTSGASRKAALSPSESSFTYFWIAFWNAVAGTSGGGGWGFTGFGPNACTGVEECIRPEETWLEVGREGAGVVVPPQLRVVLVDILSKMLINYRS